LLYQGNKYILLFLFKMNMTKILFSFAILSLIVILIIITNAFLPNFGFPILADQAIIDKINNTVLSLATSYITGYLIYYITIVIPNIKKQKVYNQFIKDIIYQFYFDTMQQYNVYYFEPDEYVLGFQDFSNKNEKYISYILNLHAEENKLNLTDTLFEERKLFINDIIDFFEYMTIEQLEIIKIVRTTDLISQIIVIELEQEQEKVEVEVEDTLDVQELKINYSQIKRNIFREYVKLIVDLKDTI